MSNVFATVIGMLLLALAPALSDTLKVMETGPPAVIGFPEINPLELSVSPAGSVPDAIDQVYGDVPPVAVRVWEYATPTVAFGKVIVEIEGIVVMVIGSTFVEVPLALSVTLKVTEAGPPAVVGVP